METLGPFKGISRGYIGNIGIMEKKMETTGIIGIIGVIQGLNRDS